MVRTISPNRCFWAANTISTAERTLEAGPVGFALRRREVEPRPAPEVNRGDEPIAGQMRLVRLRAVGRIRPDRAGGARLVQNGSKVPASVGCRIRDREPAHEPVRPVDADVVL